MSWIFLFRTKYWYKISGQGFIEITQINTNIHFLFLLLFFNEWFDDVITCLIFFSRVEKLTTENTPPREANNISNHRVLIKPEAQNNQKNKEMNKNEEKKALEAEKYGFQKVGQDKPLTKINSVKLNPLGSEYRTLPITTIQAGHFRPLHLNGSENKAVGVVLADAGDGAQHNVVQSHMESERVMQRTNSMLQLEQWIKIQRGRGQEEETRG